MGIGERLQHAWNAFTNNRDPTNYSQVTGYYARPDRIRYSKGNERSIITSVFNKIANDASQIKIKHVRTDENGHYKEDINSPLNDLFNLEANIDQTGRAFVLDVIQSMFDEGVVALMPVDTDIDPETGSFKIESIRCCKIIKWYPKHVMLHAYNDRIGRYQDVMMPKSAVAIIENPFYAVMNEPNSTLKRLIYKLNILDAIDEQSSSGKLDLIIQLPYVIKTEQKRKEAEERRRQIEMQLTGSKYGIAYTDGTERITQLNRPVENNLMNQITFLMQTLYSQLGITDEIMNGTAEDTVMLNYYTRTVEPVISAIVDECKRKFLTKTARSQGQDLMFFRDPFKLVPVGTVADMADKFTRNEILSPNEFRGIIGYKPSDDPAADELRNRNINQSNNLVDKENQQTIDQNTETKESSDKKEENDSK